jgi:hypothetical protein
MTRFNVLMAGLVLVLILAGLSASALGERPHAAAAAGGPVISASAQ